MKIDSPTVLLFRNYISKNIDRLQTTGISRDEMLKEIFGVTRVTTRKKGKKLEKKFDAVKSLLLTNFGGRLSALDIGQTLANGRSHMRGRTYIRLHHALGRREGIVPLISTRGPQAVYVIPGLGDLDKELRTRFGHQVKGIRKTLKLSSDLRMKMLTGESVADFFKALDDFLRRKGLPPGQIL